MLSCKGIIDQQNAWTVLSFIALSNTGYIEGAYLDCQNVENHEMCAAHCQWLCNVNAAYCQWSCKKHVREKKGTGLSVAHSGVGPAPL